VDVCDCVVAVVVAVGGDERVFLGKPKPEVKPMSIIPVNGKVRPFISFCSVRFCLMKVRVSIGLSFGVMFVGG